MYQPYFRQLFLAAFDLIFVLNVAPLLPEALFMSSFVCSITGSGSDAVTVERWERY